MFILEKIMFKGWSNLSVALCDSLIKIFFKKNTLFFLHLINIKDVWIGFMKPQVKLKILN